MRGTVPGLGTPYPLHTLLPAVYQEEDPFVVRFTGGLDDVLAPVISTLDNLDAYVDPLLAPEDFLDWLAGWVGVTVNDNAPLPLHRATVARAAELHRLRGTVTGLRAALELLTGGHVDITESGGVTWSDTPGAPAPGDPHPWVRVHVRVPADLGWSPDALHAAVEAAVVAAKPAHVQHVVEVTIR
ncbi:phage tail protein [Krasilnikovia sp. MM14-A1004]|uniref:phage tail protein n=1 Tax=Krasilnikovia sp. MM14-A1004 TaxID=3373541 RepID=UPI00399CE3D4